MNRRMFLQAATAVGAGMAFTVNQRPSSAAGKKEPAPLNVALLGAGQQGGVLLQAMLKLPGVHVQAVCDIRPFNRRYRSNLLKKLGHDHRAYEDHREMLSAETDLDAVIIATPDGWHARHTIDCQNAGLHVYCEKAMALTLADARNMVHTAREAGKLLQIGHQRRSNPMYQFCREKILNEAHLLGRVTTVNGQWNRGKFANLEHGEEDEPSLDQATLEKYGYASAKQLLNWRWYKQFSSGPICDVGAHQIDVYNWMLGRTPVAVIADGGHDYWPDRAWPDNIFCVFEYPGDPGPIRATYQTISTNSSNAYYESFLGDEGTLALSESRNRAALYREGWVFEDQWRPWEKKGYIKRLHGLDQPKDQQAIVDIRVSPRTPTYELLVDRNHNIYQAHLQNFFDAIRGETTLTCPGEEAYATLASILKVNEAIQQQRKLHYEVDEFKI